MLGIIILEMWHLLKSVWIVEMHNDYKTWFHFIVIRQMTPLSAMLPETSLVATK